MPNADPRDGYFYLFLTLMTDSYITYWSADKIVVLIEYAQNHISLTAHVTYLVRHISLGRCRW